MVTKVNINTCAKLYSLFSDKELPCFMVSGEGRALLKVRRPSGVIHTYRGSGKINKQV